MIDERHEELAALYAFDLLEGAEKLSFETALAGDAALQALVRELRETSSSLAHVASSATPPATLKQRVLDSVDRAKAAPAPARVIAFPNWISWGAAACFALVAAGIGQLLLSSRTEAESLRAQQALADAAAKSAQTLLETESLLAQQQIATLTARVAQTAEQLAAANNSTADANRRLGELQANFADAQRQLADATRRAEATERLLTGTRAELADLGQQLKLQGDVAQLKITTLASMLNNSPQALAVAVWNPGSQQGVLKVEKLPALAADKDYQLWVVDPQYADPVDGGVFTVDPATGEARVTFKTKQPIKAIAAYAITAERKGGVAKSAGPFLLLGKEPAPAP